MQTYRYMSAVRAAAVKMAEAGKKVAVQEQRLTSNDIVATARKAYYGTILTRQMLQLARDTRSQLELTQYLTEQLMEAGSERIDRTDYLKGQIALSTIDSMIAEAESRVQLARVALANAVGASASDEVDGAETELQYRPLDVDLDQMVAQAYVLRPDWKQIQAAICAAQAQVKLAKSGHHPKVLASGSLLRLRDNVDYGIVSPNGDNWILGIYAQVPLFTGFRTVSEVREAKARYAARCGEQELLRDGIGVQVKAAFLELVKTRDQVAATTEAWQKSIENRELNVKAYQIEMVETKDVLEAQLTETAMKKDQLLALYNWNVALIELDHVTGRGIEQIIQ